MRRLIWIAVIAGALYCAWWSVLAFGLTQGTKTWFEDRRAEGWQAETQSRSLAGFPSAVSQRLGGLAIADPDAALAIEADDLTLSLRSLWPGDVQVALPQTPLRLATPAGRGTLAFDTGRADLNLHPGTSGQLENLSFTSGPLRAEDAGQSLFAASDAELRLQEVPGSQQPDYDLRLTLGSFAPGQIPRRALLIPEDWPVVMQALQMNARMTFDRVWDARALSDRRPQPRRIDLKGAEMMWGDVRLRITGLLDMDASGLPAGEVTIKAENWQAMLDIASAAGLLPPDMRQTAQNVLQSLAAGTGKTNELDITLSLSDGLIRLGFIPLGPVPRLILR